MARVVGDIAVQVGADVSGLQDGMRKGGKAVKGFEKDAAEMGKRFAKVSIGLATAAAGIAIAVTKMATAAGETARNIQNLSNVAGVSAESFQRLAAGATTVGIEQEKLSDIFKDVNDKFGDFMATGAGPLADFFDNIAPAIGVTAEQFAKLSGPEALQLYVSSLEKAGVSQQQMTFYMEALASDTTALLPLLVNGGREMRNFGDEASRAGRILSNDAVAAGAEMDRKLKELTDTLQTQAVAAVIEYSDEILAAADFITQDLIPAIGDFLSSIGDFVTGLKPATDALIKFINLGRAAAGMAPVGGDGAGAQYSPEDQARLDADLGGDWDGPSKPINLLGAGGGAADELSALGTGVFTLNPDGSISEYGANGPTTGIAGINAPEIKPVIPTVNRKKKSGGGGGRKGGGGGRGLDRDDFEAMQQRFAEESDLIEAQREEALEKLREFRDAKLATEEEYNDLESQIQKDHAEKLAQIERTAQQQRMQAFSGALGDLSSLMQSENKKLFKIGQAAAMADAVVSGYASAVSAWEKGMKVGGPPVAAAFTAASIAKTAGLISSIQSASSSGAGGGGGAGAAGGGQAPAPQPMQVSLEGVSDNNWYSGRNINDMLDGLSEAAGDRGMIIMRPA